MERFAEHYLKHFAGQCGRKVEGYSEEARERMRSHRWPGNLRELRNAIERAVILSKDNRIEAEDLPVDGRYGFEDGPLLPHPGEMVTLEKLEEAHIRKVLERTGSVIEAAKVLGIDQATVYRKRKKMGLEPAHELQLA
jgi:NtrC-family two-component system response regulator AlgB